MNKKNYSKKNGKGKFNPNREDRSPKAEFKEFDPKKSTRYSKAMDNRKPLEMERSNDINWLNKSYLYPLATRIPFNIVAGRNTEVMWGGGFQPTGDESYPGYNPSIPGLMTIAFHPILGSAIDMNSPVNRAFNQLYGDIVSKTTGALQMQQADLAVFCTGTSNIACHIGAAKRVLEFYQTYNPLNYNMPRYLTYAMGIDFDDLVQNASLYQLQLTDIINRFNNLSIPDFSDVHRRHFSLSYNVFCDEDDIKSQIYLFRPMGIYRFDDLNHSLDYEVIMPYNVDAARAVKFGDYLENILKSIKLWENSSVTPVITGNIKRAYADSQLIKIELPDFNLKRVPIVDRNITWQVNNLRTNTVDTNSLNVTQDPIKNIVKCEPELIFNNDKDLKVHNMKYWYLNSFDKNISDEFVMEATRLIPYIEIDLSLVRKDGNEVNDAWRYKLPNAPTELIEGVVMWIVHQYEDSFAMLNIGMPDQMVKIGSADTTSADYDQFWGELKIASALSQFKNGPRAFLYHLNHNSGLEADAAWSMRDNSAMLIGDLGTYTHLHQDALNQLHLAATQSLYWAQGFHTQL